MNGDNGSGGLLTFFQWGMGIMGTILTAAVIGGGRKVGTLDREMGELKAGKAATDDSIAQLRATDERFEEKFTAFDKKLDRILDRLPEKR